jgi:hypothetical protein
MTRSDLPLAARQGRGPIHASAGIGLRAPHHRAFLDERPDVGFVEVHAENFMVAGGPLLHHLEQARRDYALSVHGVALSLGSAALPDPDHLHRLAALTDRFEPFLVSEHLAWSSVAGVYLNDLLPVPYDETTLAIIARNVTATQEALGRTILIENPSSYLRYRLSDMSEADFLAELCRRAGCALLLDVNNVAVSAFNLGFDARAYLGALPANAVGQFHVAGHHTNDVGERLVRIDDHGSAVSDEVWNLYDHALARFGPHPTLVEWDSNLPPLATLLAEAAKAERRLTPTAGARHAVAR